jgi:hypothetical protein
VRMHAFKVGKHHLAAQRVVMLRPSVLNHGICDRVLVSTSEVMATSRTRLLVAHVLHPTDHANRRYLLLQNGRSGAVIAAAATSSEGASVRTRRLA